MKIRKIDLNKTNIYTNNKFLYEIKEDKLVQWQLKGYKEQFKDNAWLYVDKEERQLAFSSEQKVKQYIEEENQRLNKINLYEKLPTFSEFWYSKNQFNNHKKGELYQRFFLEDYLTTDGKISKIPLVNEYWNFLTDNFPDVIMEVVDEAIKNTQSSYDELKEQINKENIKVNDYETAIENVSQLLKSELEELFGKWNLDVINTHLKIVGDDKYYTDIDNGDYIIKPRGITYVLGADLITKPRKYQISNTQNWFEYNLLTDWIIRIYQKQFKATIKKLDRDAKFKH